MEEMKDKDYEEIGLEYTQKSILTVTKVLEELSKIGSELQGSKKITQREWIDILERAYDPEKDEIELSFSYFKDPLGERGVHVASKTTSLAEEKMEKRKDEALKWAWGFGAIGFVGGAFLADKLLTAGISNATDGLSLFINGIVIPGAVLSATSLGAAKIGYEIGKRVSKAKSTISEEDFRIKYVYFSLTPYIRVSEDETFFGNKDIKITYKTPEKEIEEIVKSIVAFNELAISSYYEDKGLSREETGKEKMKKMKEIIKIDVSEFRRYAQRLMTY